MMQMNTRYLLGNARVGSNPAGRETFSLFSSLSGEVAASLCSEVEARFAKDDKRAGMTCGAERTRGA